MPPSMPPSTTRSLVEQSTRALLLIALLVVLLACVAVACTEDPAEALQGAFNALCWVAGGIGGVGSLPTAARKLGPVRRQDMDP
jgi:hypothetical protein